MDDSSTISMHDTVRGRSPKYTLSLSHGENRGSSPLGSANKINSLSGRPFWVSRLCLADPSIERKSAHCFGQSTLRTSQARQLSFAVPELRSWAPLAICFSLPGIRNSAHRAAGCRTWNAAPIYCLDLASIHSVRRSWSQANSQFSEVSGGFHRI